MQTTNVAAEMPAQAEPLKLLKRIGSTTYKVAIRFSEKATETPEDKILRRLRE